MAQLRQTFSASLALVCLAACGGGDNPFTVDGGGTPFGPISSDEAALIEANFDALNGSVTRIELTPDGIVPTAGQATFTGMSQIVVTPSSGGSGMTLTGDTVVNADFGGPFLSAQMDNFAGADMSGATVRLDGELRVDDARIGGAGTVSNDILGTVRGILLGSNIEIAVDGAFEGQFHGVPTTAVSFSGIDSSALYNNEAASVTLVGAAQE